MLFINSFKKNVSYLNIHIIVFLLKSGLLYLCFFPIHKLMDTYFNHRTINTLILEQSDINGIVEFMGAVAGTQSGVDIILFIAELLFGIITLYSSIFFVIDSFIDAGFISLNSNDKFFKGAKAHWISILKLKLFFLPLFVPYLFVSIYIVGSVYFSFGTITSLLISFPLAVIGLLILKCIDHAKYLVRNKKRPFKAVVTSLTSFFDNITKTIFVSILTLTFFVIILSFYYVLDQSITPNTHLTVYIALGVQQTFLFLKHFLRYIFLTLVGEISVMSDKTQ